MRGKSEQARSAAPQVKPSPNRVNHIGQCLLIRSHAVTQCGFTWQTFEMIKTGYPLVFNGRRSFPKAEPIKAILTWCWVGLSSASQNPCTIDNPAVFREYEFL